MGWRLAPHRTAVRRLRPLELEYQLPTKGNASGLYIRTPEQGALVESRRLEIQIIDLDQEASPPVNRSRAIWGVGPTTNAERPAGEWNAMQVRCLGDRVEDHSERHSRRVADMSQVPALQKPPACGFIGLSNWQGQANGAAFRNLRIKSLRPAAAPRRPTRAVRFV
ncbi:MAG: DUF1080 domain-containing protein [Gemmataceae bacterium]